MITDWFTEYIYFSMILSLNLSITHQEPHNVVIQIYGMCFPLVVITINSSYLYIAAPQQKMISSCAILNGGCSLSFRKPCPTYIRFHYMFAYLMPPSIHVVFIVISATYNDTVHTEIKQCFSRTMMILTRLQHRIATCMQHKMQGWRDHTELPIKI